MNKFEKKIEEIDAGIVNIDGQIAQYENALRTLAAQKNAHLGARELAVQMLEEEKKTEGGVPRKRKKGGANA